MPELRKIRVESTTDEDVISACNKEILSGNYDSIEWSTPPRAREITPPKGTAVIVVDLVSNQGAVRIFEKDSGEYVGGVGTEEAGGRIAVLWQDSWRFRASGVVDVGYMRAKNPN